MEKLFERAQRFEDADKAWQDALEEKYGRDAGTMRYLAQGQGMGCPKIESAYRARYAAMRAYMAAQQP